MLEEEEELPSPEVGVPPFESLAEEEEEDVSEGNSCERVISVASLFRFAARELPAPLLLLLSAAAEGKVSCSRREESAPALLPALPLPLATLPTAETTLERKDLERRPSSLSDSSAWQSTLPSHSC